MTVKQDFILSRSHQEKTMNIEVKGRTAAIVDDQVRAGRFATPEEVVDAAVTFWQHNCEQTERRPRPLDDFRADFWPEDETADDIIKVVRELRKDHDPMKRINRLP